MLKPQQLFYTFLGISTLFLVLTLWPTDNLSNDKSARDLFFTLKNILNDEKKLKVNSKKQIFFVEAHMEEKRIMDKPRAACAVESAGIK